jgi:hypothetical protein
MVAVRRLLWLALSLGWVACARQEPAPTHKGPPPPEPLLAAMASRSPGTTPKWVTELPVSSVEAPAGSSVWATVPQPGSEMAALGVYRVENNMGPAVVLVDKAGQRVDGVPAALVHPTGDTRNLKEGTLALFYSWTTPGWLGRISHARGGEELRVQFDAAGTTKETAVDHAEPARKGIAPLAFVAYPKAGVTSMGQLVALDTTRAWLLTGSGHIEIHPRAVVEALELQPTSFKAGQHVRAYRWATGFERGTIKQVLEEGLRYEVDLGPSRPAATFFLTQVVAS